VNYTQYSLHVKRVSVKPEKNIVNFFLIFQKYFEKYFRAKKIMKFYITAYATVRRVVMTDRMSRERLSFC